MTAEFSIQSVCFNYFLDNNFTHFRVLIQVGTYKMRIVFVLSVFISLASAQADQPREDPGVAPEADDFCDVQDGAGCNVDKTNDCCVDLTHIAHCHPSDQLFGGSNWVVSECLQENVCKRYVDFASMCVWLAQRNDCDFNSYIANS